MRNILALLLLSLAVTVTFSRSMHGPFVADDLSAIVHNETIRRLSPLSLPLSPPRDTAFAGRPVVNFSAALNYRFGELDPFGYRVLNSAVHTLCAWLLFLLLQHTLARSTLVEPDSRAAGALAFGVALVWAVHPLQTETVSYITQRTELIMSCCYVATLYFSAKYLVSEVGSRRILWLAAAVLACLAGMASKEVMVTAPVLVLLYDRAFVRGSLRESLRQGWPCHLGLALTWLLLAYLILPSPRSQSAGFDLGVSPVDYWLTQTKVLVMYVRLGFWPWPLSVYYQIPYLDSLGESWMYLLPTALAVSGTCAALWRNRPGGMLGAWFFLILSPTLVVPIVTEIAAERRMYLPLAALVGGLIVGGYRLLPSTKRSLESMMVVSLALAICCAWVSFIRVGEFADDVSYWTAVVRQHPALADFRSNLGLSLRRADRLEEANEQLAEAVRLDPNNVGYRNDYAGTLRRLRRFPEAEEQLLAALEVQPDMYQTRRSLGVVYERMGRTEEAIAQFETALELKPESRKNRADLAQALENTGRFESAIAQYRELVNRFPRDVAVRSRLGRLYLRVERPEEAIEHFRRAVEWVPDNGDAWNDLGTSYLRNGRAGEAIRSYAEVVRLDGASITGRFNLGRARAAAGDMEAARGEVRRARKLAVAQGEVKLLEDIDRWLAEDPR